jgi:hypothetical protein
MRAFGVDFEGSPGKYLIECYDALEKKGVSATDLRGFSK